MRQKIKLIALLAALVTLFALSACTQTEQPGSEEQSSSSQAANKDVFPAETSLGGTDISGKTVGEAITLCSDGLKNKLAGLTVQVKFESDAVEIKGSDLSYTEIIAEFLNQLFEKGTGGAHELKFAVDTAAIIEKLTPTAQNHIQEAKNSTVDSFDASSGSFTFTEPVDGKKVDMTVTAQQVADLFLKGTGGMVEAQMTTQPAAITAEQLQSKFTQLSSYETISQNTQNGTHNMAESMGRINGTVLEPGDEFSFNGIVGDSTYDGSGFLPANGLMGGVLVPMYGGGICQSSSTIYMAALYAGMEITLRDEHSSPSTYVPIGLDATVSYNDLDFRFRNPYDYPVYMVTYVDGITVHASLYGCQPEDWDEVQVSSWQSGTEPKPDGIRFVTDNSLRKGEYKLVEGHSGQYAEAQRVFYKNGEAVRTDTLGSSHYGSMRDTYKVGPGTDTDKITGGSGTTEPTPTPVPDPESQPDPEPQPDPVPDPEPDPTKAPEPTAVPDPTAEPTVAPTPDAVTPEPDATVPGV